MFKIKQFLDSDFCLECKGCCRFHDELWLPHLLSTDKRRFGIDKISTIKEDDCFFCQFLDKTDNRCKVYAVRPFECLLYPFILVRIRKVLTLAVHLACPYLKDKLDSAEFKAYSRYLSKKLHAPVILKIFSYESRIFPAYPEPEYLAIQPLAVKENHGAR